MGEYAARYGNWRTLPQVFFEKVTEREDAPLFWTAHAGGWQSQSWRQIADAVSGLSRGLRRLGLQPGDRVALISENSPHWAIADLAIMSARGLTVPAYTTNTVEDHVHILTDSGAKLAIVSTAQLAENLLAAAQRVPTLEAVICIAPVAGPRGLTIHDWQAVIDEGNAAPDDVADLVAAAARTDTACLIYTSGTGGQPKGVMLSHGAIIANCMGAFSLLNESGMLEVDAEVFLSFLPLSHSYEHTAGFLFPISIGAQIYFAESVDKLSANMVAAKPTIMTAVPRLYEMMHQRIVAGIARKGGLSAKLFNRTLARGRQRYEKHGASIGLLGDLEDKLLDRLVRAKVAERFGGRLKAFVSGGAPLNPEVGTFFLALGIRLAQGYGQTETAPVVSCNPPNKIRIHTVGPALRGVDVKIADDGEILVRGELTMQGYWNNPEATAEVLRDGWVHTGDIGLIDAQNYICITDRKKDIIVNSAGDTLSPQRIEGMLTFEPELTQAMVIGDKRPALAALVVPDDEFVKNWAKANGKSPDLAVLCQIEEFRAALAPAVDRANKRLSSIEQVRRFAISPTPFTTENAMMTPSLKIRRHVISKQFAQTLEQLYQRG